MNTRRLTRTYAIANLETMDVDPPLADTQAPVTSKKRTAIEAEISGGETEPEVPVKAKRGRPAGSKNKPKVVQTVNDTGKRVDLLLERRPAVKNVITRPQPVRRTRVVDPAGPDRPRPKRSSVEVKAAAARKAQLQEELKELNERKIQAMAEMDVQEELEDEEEERQRTSHVANTASMDGVDDIEEFSDGNQENPSSDFVADSEESQDQEEVVRAIMRAPAKRASVCSLF